MKYIKAELIKYRHSMINKLLVLSPLLTILFAYLAGGSMNFQYIATYWWYAFILQGVVAVLCYLSIRSEEKSGNYTNTFTLPIDLKGLKNAKNIVMVGKILVAELICAFMIHVITYVVFPDYLYFSIGRLLVANIVIVITTMWQIPFCFLIMRFIGKFAAIIVNVLMGLICIAFFGTKSYWMAMPYCWGAKEMEKLLRIGVNGVFMDNVQSFDIKNVIVIVLSVIFFAVLVRCDASLYEKEVNK